MDRVTLLTLGALVAGSCVLPPVAAAQPVAVSDAVLDRWTPFIAEAAARFGLPEAWIRAVMAAESGGRIMLDGRPIRSPAGAIGLMQVMPDTYEEMRRRHGLGPDPHSPRDNILAGAAYLRAMHDRFGWPGFFAAYNAGPARYEDHLRTGRPLPAETQTYLASLANHKSTASKPAEPVSGRSIFFVRNGVPQARSEPSANRNPDRRLSPIFVPLSHERR